MSGWYGKGLGMVQVEAEEEDGGDAEEAERIGSAERAHFLLATEATVQPGAPRYFVSESRNTCTICSLWMERWGRGGGRGGHRVDRCVIVLVFSGCPPAPPLLQQLYRWLPCLVCSLGFFSQYRYMSTGKYM